MHMHKGGWNVPRRSLWLDDDEETFVSSKPRGYLRRLVRREMTHRRCDNCGKEFPGVLNACPYCRLPVPTEQRWDQ